MIETAAVAAVVAFGVSVGWSLVVRRIERRKIEAARFKLTGRR